MENLIITPDEAARLLRESKQHVMDSLNAGDIPAYKVGANWKIPIRTLQNYIENKALQEARARKEILNAEKEKVQME